MTRDTLITALWDDEAFVSDNTLTVNVNRLRKKLSEIGMETEIETKVGKDIWHMSNVKWFWLFLKTRSNWIFWIIFLQFVFLDGIYRL